VPSHSPFDLKKVAGSLPGLSQAGCIQEPTFISPSGGQHLPGLFVRANLAAVFEKHLFFPSDCFFQSQLWEWKERC